MDVSSWSNFTLLSCFPDVGQNKEWISKLFKLNEEILVLREKIWSLFEIRKKNAKSIFEKAIKNLLKIFGMLNQRKDRQSTHPI